MERDPAERAATERFDVAYSRLETPVMRAITRHVFCCDHPGNSWTTRREADELVAALGLRPDSLLADLGTGAGWPGLYLAASSGCSAVLVDIPESGLRMARARAVADGLGDRIDTRRADAGDLPFPDASFDAVSHSDLLCCLIRKREVLLECRRVLRPRGRMAFSVIYVSPNVKGADRSRAIAAGPEFVETDTPYPALLAETGWRVLREDDLTADFLASIRRQIEADRRAGTDLVDLIGAEAAAERMRDWTVKQKAVAARQLCRALFLACPA